MRVLAIDPGLTRCGIGVVDTASSSSISLVSVGVLKSSAELSIEIRLKEIDRQIREWITEHRPDVIAVVDATDALALAICHIWRGAGDARLNSAIMKERSRLGSLKALKA